MADKKISVSAKSRRLMIRETATSYLFLAPFLVFFVMFVIYPMFMCVYTSFFDATMGREDIFVGFQNYKTLLNKCQYYLAYATVVEVTNKTTYKVGNFGVSKTTDENMQVATQDEVAKMQYYYQTKVDACCYDLQSWLIENRASFPELSEHDCRRISSNLYSAATCGIFLGGVRGKSKRRCRR